MFLFGVMILVTIKDTIPYKFIGETYMEEEKQEN